MNMKQKRGWLSKVLAVASALVMGGSALAETVITTFDDDFQLDGLFAWSDAVVVSTATNYSITDTGYGSGYKDINPNLDATGETTIQLTVTLSANGGSPTAPISGPIVSLVDGDGTFYNFAWYGKTAGTYVLTAPLKAPTSIQAAGSVAGLDLATLDFFHLQDDPGSYHGEYTITFEDLRLIGAPGPQITARSYDAVNGEFTLTWTSKEDMSYAVLHTSNLGARFQVLASDIPSGGTTTTATVPLPAGNTGFLQIQQQ